MTAAPLRLALCGVLWTPLELVALAGLPGQDACPPETPFAFALAAPGATGAPAGSALDVYVLPAQPYSVNRVLGPDYEDLAPCFRGLEVRVHVRDDSEFVRADANFDSRIDVSDPVTVLRTLFHGDAPIRCSDAADSNDDSKIDISDAVYIFGYLFLGGPEPPAPFPGAGADPTADELHCIEHS